MLVATLKLMSQLSLPHGVIGSTSDFDSEGFLVQVQVGQFLFYALTLNVTKISVRCIDKV